jgi:DNA invertase Pin-like site-specific DNA recombinase
MADFGYARVSTTEQDPQLQLDVLAAVGVPSENVYVDHASGNAAGPAGVA